MKNSITTSKSVASILLIGGLLVLANGFFRGSQSIQTFMDLRQNLNIMDATVTDLQDENEKLQNEIHKLKTSPDYARKVLRDKYHVTDPDERIMFFSE